MDGTRTPIKGAHLDNPWGRYGGKVLNPYWVVFENAGRWPFDPQRLVENVEANSQPMPTESDPNDLVALSSDNTETDSDNNQENSEFNVEEKRLVAPL